jgi:cytoskeletal protein RodZ
MSENAKSLSFGRYLRSVRREKGIALEQVAAETRIGLDTLKLIEQEDIAGLPAEVFVKGFIRSYAKAVGADADRAVAGYLQGLARLQKTEQSEADLDRISNRFWPHMLMAAGILILVIVFSIFALSGFSKKEAAPENAEPSVEPAATTTSADNAVQRHRVQSQAAEAPAPPPPKAKKPEFPSPAKEKPETAVSAAAEPARTSAEPTTEKQILEITAVAETWMKIVVDEDQVKEVTLKPGDRLSLEASSGYELLIGNVAGVDMRLNGEPVALGGRSGQVRSLTLP